MMQRLVTIILFLTRVSSFTPVNKRIFVGGNFGTIDNLARMFRAYGRIEEIRLHEDVAFVTFVAPESAEAALQHECPEMKVKPSQPMELRQQSEVRKRRTVEQWEQLMFLAHNSNCVIQVPKIHLDGLRYYCSNHMERVEVVGALDTASNDVSMLYLKAEDATLADRLHDAAFVRYSKIYPSLDRIVRGSLMDVARQAWSDLEKLPSMPTVRFQVFPPTLQNALLAALEEFLPSTDIRISSDDYSHVYSVVRLVADGSDERGGVFMVGLAEPASPLSNANAPL